MTLLNDIEKHSNTVRQNLQLTSMFMQAADDPTVKSRLVLAGTTSIECLTDLSLLGADAIHVRANQEAGPPLEEILNQIENTGSYTSVDFKPPNPPSPPNNRMMDPDDPSKAYGISNADIMSVDALDAAAEASRLNNIPIDEED